MNPSIAIIERNTLSSIALEELLSNIFPTLEIVIFRSMEEFLADCDRYFVRFFIGQSVLIENTKEFEMLKEETVVLCEGSGTAFANAGYNVLDVTLSEKKLIGRLLGFNESVHRSSDHSHPKQDADALSARESEVLTLIVKGYLNKEIADKLSLSVTTVIFHRNNICSKLGTRSVGRLTLYALLNNLVESSDL